MDDWKNREQGILTSSQRRYYLDDSYIDGSSAKERAIRSKVRKRLRNALFDLSILMENMEDRDVRQSLEKDGQVDGHMVGALGLLYRCCGDGERFEKDVERAIERVGSLTGSQMEVSVNIDIETSFEEDIIERYEKEGAGSLEPEALYELEEKGYLTKTEFERELFNVFLPARPGTQFDELMEKLEDEMESYDSLDEYADDIYDEYMD